MSLALPLLFVFCVSFGAFAISTLSGGGAGLLLLPALMRVLPGAEAPAALTVGTAASTGSKLALFWNNVRWGLTLELEWNGGIAIEVPVSVDELGTAHRTMMTELAEGRRIVKVERVWRYDRTYYELYVDDAGTVRSLDFG